MDSVLLITYIVITIIIVGVLVWLILVHKKLRQDYNNLNEYLERNSRDIAGLCSAAVSVDSRLSDNNVLLNVIKEKIADFEQQQQQTSQPYHSAIQKVRNGANEEELIQQCGLSREEALLLIRLHGNSKS